jgi:protease I
VRNRRATCYRSISTDLKNAGGVYEDEAVVVDDRLVISRRPADLPNFCREILRILKKLQSHQKSNSYKVFAHL